MRTNGTYLEVHGDNPQTPFSRFPIGICKAYTTCMQIYKYKITQCKSIKDTNETMFPTSKDKSSFVQRKITVLYPDPSSFALMITYFGRFNFFLILKSLTIHLSYFQVQFMNFLYQTLYIKKISRKTKIMED